MIRLLSHEAEDIDDIPDELRNDDLLTIAPERKTNQPTSMHRALTESRIQGTRSMKHLLNNHELLRVRRHLLNIEGRRNSFLFNNWMGPSVILMADAGFHYSRHQVATCSFCDVSIRDWKPDHSPWVRHKTFSPLCAYLRCKGESGIHPSASGKRTRHDSYSSFEEIKAGCAYD
ncbi:hypothetical protein C0Q70_11366 [Pomacea canaliculata]|uniref:Uncharacterized protein n=2 Tax=Pomacea canaliculata TaxID=400727 RepID=A0A2T7P5T6_POMCA|nr:hypothetical protein C0Q70_11366 [Pomacea canaliculata]